MAEAQRVLALGFKVGFEVVDDRATVFDATACSGERDAASRSPRGSGGVRWGGEVAVWCVGGRVEGGRRMTLRVAAESRPTEYQDFQRPKPIRRRVVVDLANVPGDTVISPWTTITLPHF